MAHSYSHDTDDECVMLCHSEHEKDLPEDTGGSDHGDQEKAPRHHSCCHFPSADRTMEPAYLPVCFSALLVEIAIDESLAPEEPCFSLEKPPLI